MRKAAGEGLRDAGNWVSPDEEEQRSQEGGSWQPVVEGSPDPNTDPSADPSSRGDSTGEYGFGTNPDQAPEQDEG